MLYGRFAHIVHAPGPSSPAQSSFIASAATTRTAGRSPTTSSSAGTSARSNSIASTSAPADASAIVSDPSPAPTSTTRTPGAAPASAAIARPRFGSIRKCWPSDLDGRMP